MLRQTLHRLSKALFIVIALSAVALPKPVWSYEAISEITDVSFLPTPQTIEISNAKYPKMTVNRTVNGGEANLLIDKSEVLKLYGASGTLTAKDRVEIVKKRLQHYLQQGGSARDIKPGEEKGNIVVRAGATVLVTVDAETAKKSNLSAKQVAFLWTNLIRKSLGADTLDRDTNMVASRGFGTSLVQIRKLSSTGKLLKGFASWYGPGFHGRRCANGERFNMYSMTAAHRTLPFNTLVKVTNGWTGRSTVVRITDRGPYAHGRIIDLSKSAAQAIGMLSSGTAPVTVEVLGR